MIKLYCKGVKEKDLEEESIMEPVLFSLWRVLTKSKGLMSKRCDVDHLALWSPVLVAHTLCRLMKCEFFLSLFFFQC